MHNACVVVVPSLLLSLLLFFPSCFCSRGLFLLPCCSSFPCPPLPCPVGAEDGEGWRRRGGRRGRRGPRGSLLKRRRRGQATEYEQDRETALLAKQQKKFKDYLHNGAPTEKKLARAVLDAFHRSTQAPVRGPAISNSTEIG